MRNAVKNAAAMPRPYTAMGEKTGIVSSEVNTKVFVVAPPPIPMTRPPTTQPVSMSG